MKRVVKNLSSVLSFIFLCLSIFQFRNVSATAEENAGNKAFYISPYHANPDAKTIIDGLETYMRYEVTKPDGSKDYSSNSWINTDWSYTTKIGKRGDFLDINQVATMAQEVYIKNTTGADMPINIKFTYPRKEIADAGYYAPIVSGEPVVENTDTINSFDFDITGLGVNTLDLARANADTNWSNLRDITIRGTLGAGKEISIKTPLKIENIENVENVYFSSDIIYNTPRSDKRYVTVRGAKSVYKVDDLIFGNYVGTYLYYYTDDDGTTKEAYVRVPKEIQAVMPEVKKSDLYYTLWDYIGTVDMNNRPNISDESAFWLSDYAIRLTGRDGIFERVSPLGYSVLRENVANPTKVRDYYYYSLGNRGLVIYDEEGKASQIGRVDENGFNLSKYYVELAKVLDTEDKVLNINSSWSDFDNLTYHMKVHSPRMNPDTEIPLASLATNSNVDVSVPGSYTVKYSYDVGRDIKPDDNSRDIVSKTAKVDVVASKVNIVKEGIADQEDRPIAIEILKDSEIIDTVQLDAENNFKYSSALLNRFDELSGKNFKYEIRVLSDSVNYDVDSELLDENNIFEFNFKLKAQKATSSEANKPIGPEVPNKEKDNVTPKPLVIDDKSNVNGGSGTADSAGAIVKYNDRTFVTNKNQSSTPVEIVEETGESQVGNIAPNTQVSRDNIVIRRNNIPKTSDFANNRMWIIFFVVSMVFLDMTLLIKNKEK